MNNSVKKLLFLSLQDICYNSTGYFEKRISDELAACGIEITHLKLPKASDMAYAILKPYFDADYDAVMDINSRIPVMKYNDEYILGHFHIPVWHYILDHPLYHYEALSAKLYDYRIICLDILHKELITESFPDIKAAYTIPLAADSYTDTYIQYDNVSLDNISDYFNRPDNLIFTGTYTDPIKTSLLYSTQNAIDNHPLFTNLLEIAELSQEEVVRLLMENHIIDEVISPIEYLYNNFLIDVYLQAVIREEIITQIIKNRIDITIYGHGWDTFADKCDILAPDITKYLHIRPEVNYDELPHLYSSARMSVNQMPWFKYGMHDRIPLSLMNKCICLSDNSLYLSETLKIDKGYGIHTYSLEALDELPDIINDISHKIQQKNEAVINELSAGYNFATHNFTWKAWVKTWLGI